MITTAIEKYLEKPRELMRAAGLLGKTPESQLVGLLNEVQQIDQPKILAIATAVRDIDTFNDYVADQAQGMHVSDRFNAITEKMASVRYDGKMLLKHAEDNKITTGEKLAQVWMKVSRGSISDRVAEVGKIYTAVCKDIREQIDRETEVLNAYQDFRSAIKEAEVLAHEVAAEQKVNVGTTQDTLTAASTVLETYNGENAAEKGKLELARDVAIRNTKTEQAKHKLLEEVAQNLQLAYGAGEVLTQKIEQINEAKRAIYTKAVAFYGTNKQILTTLGFAFVAEQGVHEMTETTARMGDELNKGLETLAELGSVDKEAMRVANETLYSPDSIRKLVDAINTYEEEVARVVIETRAKSQREVAEIRGIVEDGKKKRVSIITGYLTDKQAA